MRLPCIDIENIKKWYINELQLDPDSKSRVTKCAHFINKGMNSCDIEAYIHYFVALDALYGKIGSVERSIQDGVEKLPQEDVWSEKIPWLFDLRNELVHGGSRYIKEWGKYMKYYYHFSSEPSIDIEKLAFLALSQAPQQLNSSVNPQYNKSRIYNFFNKFIPLRIMQKYYNNIKHIHDAI